MPIRFPFAKQRGTATGHPPRQSHDAALVTASHEKKWLNGWMPVPLPGAMPAGACPYSWYFATSVIGTERTNWAGLLMSVDWGRPVVAG